MQQAVGKATSHMATAGSSKTAAWDTSTQFPNPSLLPWSTDAAYKLWVAAVMPAMHTRSQGKDPNRTGCAAAIAAAAATVLQSSSFHQSHV
jgi:hypothetical protein